MAPTPLKPTTTAESSPYDAGGPDRSDSGTLGVMPRHRRIAVGKISAVILVLLASFLAMSLAEAPASLGSTAPGALRFNVVKCTSRYVVVKRHTVRAKVFRHRSIVRVAGVRRYRVLKRASAYCLLKPLVSVDPPVSTGPIDLNPPDGYVFNGGGTYTTSGTLKLGNDCTIIGVNFTNGGRAVAIKGGHNTVRDCTFGPDTWAALMITVGSCNVIDRNTFNTTPGQGANIQVCGGGHNKITNNVTKGGVTGIIFLYSRSLNGGGAASLITDNLVSGNTCSGFTQEGITFDVLGNRAADMPCLEYDTVRAVNGSAVTLSELPFPSYVGYDMVFVSGAQNGRTRSIVRQSRNAFTLDSAPKGVAVGDKVIIGAPFEGNVVRGNTVTASKSTWPAINLYGMCYQNVITNNHVLTGTIRVESTDNLDVATGSATKTYGRAPCGFNTVKGNVVAGAVQLQYYAWPTSPSGHADSYTPFQTVGNNVVGNRCLKVEANQQKCYVADNSGPNAFSHVLLSRAEMH